MIPFNRPSYGEAEAAALQDAIAAGYTAGNGPQCKAAEQMLSSLLGDAPALLTTSCTHALELSADLLDLRPGDEVIVPSYTFTSSAAAFVRAGAKVVFCDVDPVTLGMDVRSMASCITSATRAICVVHYAGVAPEMDEILRLATLNGLVVIEDNAHGLGASYGGRPLGTFGAMATQSFHETKNVSCGEGGAIVLNDKRFLERAEILREKGTNRARFLRGQVDKYSWIEAGSSWVLSDLLGGILRAQLERFAVIQQQRHAVWSRYALELADWAHREGVRLPILPSDRTHPAHLFHLRLGSIEDRDRFIAHLRSWGVMAVFHYQPLHLSPFGKRYHSGLPLPVSEEAGRTLVRLPLFADLSSQEVDAVVEAVRSFRRG